MTRNLDPVIIDLVLTPYDNFKWMPNYSFGPPKCKNVLKIQLNWVNVSFLKLNGFHDNLSNNSKECNVPKEILISQQQLL